jgi:hypothetical protein
LQVRVDHPIIDWERFVRVEWFGPGDFGFKALFHWFSSWLTGLAYILARKQKKPTQPNPETAGFNCVGLLINGSSGHLPDYPLFSHPKIQIFWWELILVKAPLTPIIRLLIGLARQLHERPISCSV